MKRFLGVVIPVALLFSASTFVATSAQAVAPTAQCAKVKAQVAAYEKIEKVYSVKYASVNGKWSWFFTSVHQQESWLLQKEIVNFEVKLFAYYRANLTCFTLRQQDYAKAEYQKWIDNRDYLKNQPDWVAGINFIPIEWDSIFSR